MLIAPGTRRFKNDDVAIAVPNILFAGYLDAKNPPGTCVIKYPQKNDESTALSTPTDQLNLTSSKFIELLSCKK